MSVDPATTLADFTRRNSIKHLLLSDARRQMLPAYGALTTDEKSPIYRYGKRAYFVVDRAGIVRWMKIQDNPLDLLDPSEVLAVVRKLGA